jgi:dihydrofolate synthase/folylpolyglutamate synthase
LNVIKNTGLQGRWQQLNENPKTICDTAHNAHGLKIVLNQIKIKNLNNLHIVLGVVNDKDLMKFYLYFLKMQNIIFANQIFHEV